jgi:leucyl-tRNA synthetase
MGDYGFQPAGYEEKWQRFWESDGTFRAVEDPSKPKYYVLCMFPYPSGAGLHVGHPESYTAVDIVARFKRMNGFSVLNPIGWDAFGLPAERAAVRENRHPGEITAEYIANFKRQLLRLGFSYDWDREISTCEPEYYRWTQWIFLKLHERGLAYLAEVPVNWCPAQGTVLANEEVVDGRYVETGDPVERRMMKQWMLRITAYADRLVDDLEGLDWPEGVLEMQRKWIGRSEGAEITFAIEGQTSGFTVFTTRPDTLMGATYCVLAPEHALVAAITTPEQSEAVAAYVAWAKNRSDLDRQVGDKEKTGVFTGAYAKHPITGAPVPIWIADYVLASYGTGAIMAVPAHDERDHAFAKRFGLGIVQVVGGPADIDVQAAAWTGDGPLVHSGAFDGLEVEAAKKAVTAWLVEHGCGARKVQYKLRDWLFSRQRYWGEPFPVVHRADGRVQPLPVDALPVSLPYLSEFKPTADGRPPLARAEAWLETELDGEAAERETNTMPQWAGSCWYYLRYMDPKNTTAPFDPAKAAYWGPVDLYIGGVEHAVLHLLYARFWHKVLYDCGLVTTPEPFQKLFNQGMILAFSFQDAQGKYYHPSEVEQRGERWFVKGTETPVSTQIEKMSKSKKNVVDPMEIVDAYGADALRIYEMFMGPLEQVKPWQTSGCEGVYRFLGRVWRLFVDEETGANRPFGPTSREVRKALHDAIREATVGVEQLKLNTPVSKMMAFVNTCRGELPARADAEDFLRILSLYAPHLAEELWSRLGHTASVSREAWPVFDPSALIDDTVTIAVQVLGKLRGQVVVAREAPQDVVLAAARAEENVAKFLAGKEEKKVIYVPGRLVNFVVA